MKINIDLSLIPFSHRGSYLAISYLNVQRAEKPGLWLRSVREIFNPGPLFLIEASRLGKVCRFVDDAQADQLTLAMDGGGSIRIAFDGPRCVRFLVEGCSLHLSSPGGEAGEGEHIAGASEVSQITPAGEGRWRVIKGMSSLYALETLQGVVRVHAQWTGRGSKNNTLVVDGENGPAELAVSESDGLENGGASRRDFAACVINNAKSFSHYLLAQRGNALKIVQYEAACNLATYLNWSSLVRPEGQLKREGMLMSKNWMTALWSWDHCFNALALRHGDPELAWEQFLAPFDHQNEQGALPDLISVRTVIRSYVKPPIHGWVFSQLWAAAPAFYTFARLHEAYQKLEAWTDFWFTYRDPYNTGFPVYYHGNDSGWDNATSFLAGSPLSSPDLCAFLILQMHTLADIAKAINKPREAVDWCQKAEGLLRKMVEFFWKDGTWRVVAPAPPESCPPPGADSLLPYMAVVLGEFLPSEIFEACVAQLSQKERFLTCHGLATESVASEYYEKDGYWRGPIWAPSTLLMIDGLARGGATELATRLNRSFCDMCRAEGMAENYDAKEGKGLRDRGYTWTASVFLDLVRRLGVAE